MFILIFHAHQAYRNYGKIQHLRNTHLCTHSIYATPPSPRMFSTYNKPLTQRQTRNSTIQLQVRRFRTHINKPYHIQPGTTSDSSDKVFGRCQNITTRLSLNKTIDVIITVPAIKASRSDSTHESRQSVAQNTKIIGKHST